MNARRILAIALALTGFAATGCAVAVSPGPGHGQDKVLVCHKGKKTLEVAAPALDAHLRHGDTRGRCR